VEKAQAGYMELVFDALLEQSTPVDDSSPFPKRWIGPLTSLVRDVTLEKTGKRGNYQKIKDGLYELGAVEQLYRGGGKTTSEYLITRAQLYVNEDGTPAKPKQTYQNTPAKQTTQALNAINTRLILLERQMTEVFRALASDLQRPLEQQDKEPFDAKAALQSLVAFAEEDEEEDD
jgi:hypothetical protein